MADTDELLAHLKALASEHPARESDELWALVSELQRRGDAETFRTAVAWSTDQAVALRCLSADLIGQLGHDDGHPFAAQSAPVLASLMIDPEPEVIACALIALGHLEIGDTSAIADLASHPDARVRHAVAVCLGPREEERATAALVILSRDQDRDVRDWATFGLGSLSEVDSPEIREALAARLGDPDDDVRGEAMVGLAARGVREVGAAVLAELGAIGSGFAVKAAATLADPMFIPELDRLLAAKPGAEDIRSALEVCRRPPRPA